MELKREAEYCDVLFPFTDGTSLSKNRRQVFSAAGDFVLESLTVSLGLPGRLQNWLDLSGDGSPSRLLSGQLSKAW